MDSLSLSAEWIFGIFVRSNFFKQPVSRAYQRLTDKSGRLKHGVEFTQKTCLKMAILGRLEVFKTARLLFLIYLIPVA